MTAREEYDLISGIARKAHDAGLNAHDGLLGLIMDIECVHEVTPLRLQALHDATCFDMAHDIVGIQRNLNRRTKRLENCFVPRYTA